MKRNGHGLFIRLAVLLLAVLLVPVLAYNGLAAQEAVAMDPECYEHGDVNGDGVVDSRDAVQILYHSVFDDETETYPVNQDCDFDGDGKVDRKDALYILYGSFQLSQYPLDGQIHQFYAPEWRWGSEGAVEVAFKCGCGQTHSFNQDSGITVIGEKTAQENCLNAGKVVYTATVSFGDKEHTDTYEVIIPAAGHQMTGTQSCTTASTCANCDYSVAALGHSWQADPENSVAATCKTDAVEAFKCGVCGDTKTNPVEGRKPHNYVYVEDVAISDCEKEKRYQCSVCQEAEMRGDRYATHTYVATIEPGCEATCIAKGTKKYTCKKCGDFYTEDIPENPNAHSWDAGVTADGITTYTCTSCYNTKTAVVVTDGTTATVSKEALHNTEVQVNDASIKLDQQTLEELGEEVQIDVAVVDTAEVVLDEDLKEQIGDNPVYDFNLSSDQTQVSQFAGEITISLPYSLQEGDDVDCIDVWFINDEGEVECVMGTYSNGQVTFTTNHFSYYTVTRLTPKQRCEHYGHLYNYSYKAATCTSAGYDIQTCKRCGDEDHEVLPMLEHKFVETVQKATCLENGRTTKQCPVCKLKITNDLPALGHNWEKNASQSKDATCNAAGYETFVCDGCGDSYRNDLAQLEHIYETEEEKKADCGNHGHKKERCILCGEKKEKNTDAPTGHDYTAENAVWEWAEDYSSAKVTLVCAYDAKHTKTLTAVVGRELGDGKTCSSKITYKAVASFNKAEFTDIMEVDMGTVQHTPGTELLHDANSHYYACQVCKEKVSAAKHSWNEGKVLTEPTCVKDGLEEFQCTICGAERQQSISPTGVHTYVDHVCTGCGLVENTCTHFPLSHVIAIDNEKWGICEDTIIEFRTCDCGEYTGFVRREGCSMDRFATETVVTDAGTFELNLTKCVYCGLVNKTGYYEELDKENCITTWYEIYALYMEDELIAIDYNLMVPDGQPVRSEHTMNRVQEIDLAEYGMCGDVLLENACYCGEYTHTSVEYSNCKWEVLATDDENITKEVCVVCGVARIRVFEHVAEGCDWTSSNTYTYELDGEEVYSFNVEWGGKNCESEIVDVEYMNGSCENGAIVYYECINCGEESQEVWYGSHPHVYREEIPVEAEGICYNRVNISSCPCGESTNIDYSTGCYFFLMESNDDGKYQRFVCTTCGLTRIVERSYSEKDANCNCYETVKHTYTDPEGNVLLQKQAVNYGEYHNIQNIRKLMEGSVSCEDGVSEKEICADCGLITYENEYYDHWTYPVATYRCADYGMCGDVMAVYGCACGQTSGVSTVEFRCNWEYAYTPETGMYYQCHTCNTTKTYDSYMVSENGCEQVWSSDTVYLRDGEEVMRIKAPYKQYNHRSVYTFELLGESCSDGYLVTEHCLDCGYYRDWGEYSNLHDRWVIDREYISQGRLCGDLESVTYSCACGQEKYTNMEWRNGSCNYENGEYYIMSLGAWAQKCTKCGIERVRHESVKPGSTQCESIVTHTYTFRKSGVSMFTHVLRNTQNSHVDTYTFKMHGESCSDGYTVYAVCSLCGDTRNWGTYSGCSSWLIGVENMDLGAESCGNAAIRIYACPCGSVGYVEVESPCGWEWMDWTEETGTIYHCNNCDLYRYDRQTSVKKPNSCQTTETEIRKFVRNNELVNEFVWSRNGNQHAYVNTFELHGETCADGFTRTEKCSYCGRLNGVWEEIGDHWMIHTVDIIDLTQYGLCNGQIAKRSCACGAKLTYEMYSCSMDCSTCGTVVSSSHNARSDRENCRELTTYVYEFTRNGEVVYKFEGEGWAVQHELVADFRLYNEEHGCEDGYEVTMKCRNCDYGYTESGYGHNLYEAEYLYFKDFDESLCSGAIVIRKCACGKYLDDMNSYSSCWCTNSEYESFVDEQGFWHYRYTYPCDICGMEKVEEWYDVVDTENCIEYQAQITAYRYNGEVLYENLIKASVRENHTYSNVSYALMDGAQSCSGGVVRTYSCKCGASFEDYIYYHENYTLEEIDLTQYGMCSGTLVHETCACGANENWNLYASCGGCGICGLTFTQTSNIEKDPETCATITEITCRITDGEEVVLEKVVKKSTGYAHTFVTSFELMGETCLDGYSYTEVCTNCGETGISGNDSSNHSCYTTEIIDMTQKGMCTGYIYKWSCACGEEASWYLAPTCGSGCSVCGTEFTTSQESVYDPENCRILKNYTFSFTRNGEEFFTFTGEGQKPSHQKVAQFKLYDAALGCDGGYEVTMVCQHCDMTESYSGYYHETYAVDYLYFSDVDEEICDGFLTIQQCACGSREDFNNSSFSCDFGYMGYQSITDEEGELRSGYIYRCETCGLERIECSYSVYDMDNCKYHNYYKTLYRRNEEMIAVAKYIDYSYDQHLTTTTFRLFDEAAGCEGGYEATADCRLCDYTYTWTEYNNCSTTYPVDYLFMDALDGEFCDGYIEKLSCACGKYERFDNDDASCSFVQTNYEDDTDAQGIYHSIYTYTCEHCGLEYQEDYYNLVDEENCISNHYKDTTYRVNGKTVMDGHDLTGWGSHHTYENIQYQLIDGATNCDQGVVETGTCKYCGEVDQTWHYYHVTIPVKTIDLQQYGAVCNTQFVRRQCLCGQSSYNEFAGEDACDMSHEGIESWITDAVCDGQETTEGYIWLGNDAWIYTCAVTDPQCAFKARNAQYYTVENCMATQYETWQFGYNPEDGSCAYEFTVATGEQRAFHDYEYTYERQQIDEANYMDVHTYVCTACKSTYTQTNTYVDDYHYSTDSVAVNTLKNGENQYRRDYYEYGFQYEDHAYGTVNRYEYIYADGSEYWYQYQYTYDFTNGCNRTCEFTNSNGEYSVTDDICHSTQWESETIKNATCSQFGEYKEGWFCVVCGWIESEWTNRTDPTDHNWLPDPTPGVYICGFCGLQNANGASGSIVMEDMTNSYGENIDYVVGYWNKSDISVHKYVSVVLKDAAEGAEDELILDGINFFELNREAHGITAIAFNQAAVAAKASAAMEEAGYTGDYAIRFTFVPTSGEDTLDYAITFDSLSA